MPGWVAMNMRNTSRRCSRVRSDGRTPTAVSSSGTDRNFRTRDSISARIFPNPVVDSARSMPSSSFSALVHSESALSDSRRTMVSISEPRPKLSPAPGPVGPQVQVPAVPLVLPAERRQFAAELLGVIVTFGSLGMGEERASLEVVLVGVEPAQEHHRQAPLAGCEVCVPAARGVVGGRDAWPAPAMSASGAKSLISADHGRTCPANRRRASADRSVSTTSMRTSGGEPVPPGSPAR